MTSICIIGHGASPKGKGWGSRIDENVVIRLKNPSWQSVEDYGKRVDYMVASTETMPVMLDYQRKPKEYWAQPKRGKWAASVEASFRTRTDIPLKIPLDIHNRWNGVFLNLREKEDCPNHSVGMAAITYACEFLKPDEIQLVGFDNLLNPDLPEYHKSDRGKWVTRHDWKAENSMLPMIEKEYGVKIGGFR
jgi:hypothetical protein